ncbi:MAG: LytTR family DNA-binding domain-containing protein [Angelakisella sp.]
MKIAICDAFEEERAVIKAYLQAYFASVDVWEYDNGGDLVHAHEKNRFSLIVLDMLLPDQSGMESAAEIRTFDEETPIAFVTDTEEFAMQSYSVEALDYLLKPIRAETMMRCLDRFIKRSPDQRFVSVKYMGVRVDILLSKIVFLESELHRVILHLSDNKTIVLTAKMEDFAELMSEPDFCRCHKSFLVNLNYVDGLSDESLHLRNGTDIRISRTFADTAKAAYYDYAFGKGSRMRVGLF